MNSTPRYVLASSVTLLLVATQLACAQTPSPAAPAVPTPATESGATDPLSPQNTPAPAPTPAEQWASFVAAWNTGDAAQLASYEALQDLLVLDNPGAFVRMTSFPSLAAFFAQAGVYDGARVPKLRFSSTLKNGTAPVTNCDTEVTLTGSYLTEPARAQLVRRVAALSDYQLAPAEEVARLKALVQAIEAGAVFAVYDLDQSVGLIFAQNKSGISLLAIDAVVPCSA